jgi:nicotinamidase-related amidase
MWQRYYSRWRETTRDRINPALLELLPPLAKLSPPATLIGKTRFSGFAEPQLLSHLQARNADGLVITGSETDVCVLGTVLGAVDFGYRVIIVRDAVCSSSDEGHDALMEVYHSRFSEQIETANADEILDAWSSPFTARSTKLWLGKVPFSGGTWRNHGRWDVRLPLVGSNNHFATSVPAGSVPEGA